MQNIEQEPKAILKKYKKLLLQLDNNRSDRFSKVKKIYKFIDSHNDKIFKKDTVCAKGCAYCCYINIDVAEVEASYIAQYAKKPLKENINNSVHANISKYNGVPSLKCFIFLLSRFRINGIGLKSEIGVRFTLNFAYFFKIL